MPCPGAFAMGGPSIIPGGYREAKQGIRRNPQRAHAAACALKTASPAPEVVAAAAAKES